MSLDAVAHAHANLIVHRDIKPANVLVSTDGQVKLLDFGIAKLMEPDSAWTGTAASALTREGGPVLTPEYAAPEQLSGGAVTTATDVYALGVLLYVLLSGRHPAGEALRSPATLIGRSSMRNHRVCPMRSSPTAQGRRRWNATRERAARRRRDCVGCFAAISTRSWRRR